MYGTEKKSVFIKTNVANIGYSSTWLLYLKRGKLHEYAMLTRSSIHVRISLHGDATTALF